jgi:hypothetical protein
MSPVLFTLHHAARRRLLLTVILPLAGILLATRFPLL